MAGLNKSTFKNPVINWIDTRLPIFTMLSKEYGVFPTPRNFSYLWSFGGIAMTMLTIMILSGIFLAMHYTPNSTMAFDSVERIMRDVNYGWLMRYIHMNGASFFFIAVYIHIFRGFYYGSYKAPRELLWIFGVVIFLLMMATAFMGYTLPWSQMSGWGATVITNLFSAFPLVGDAVVTWLWGGFSVDNPTLNRFFALHYLLPFIIAAVVFLHVWALHVTGSNNPAGVEPKTEKDTLPFHPYYTAKDSYAVVVFMLIFAVFIFFIPLMLTHPDHFREFDPMVTPPHIVPEWYFLPFYAILRAFTQDLTPILLFFVGAAGLTGFFILGATFGSDILSRLGINRRYSFYGAMVFTLSTIVLAFLCFDPKLYAVVPSFLKMILIEAKLQGVLAMFGSILLWMVMPWLDRSPVRSCRYRPVYKWFLWLLVVAFFALGYAGAQKAEGLPLRIGQAATAYYFLFFLGIVPVLGKKERPLPLPESIAASCGAGKKAVVALLFAGLLALPATPAGASEDGVPPPKQEWSHKGTFGTYDRAQLQRGFQVYKEVCAACHSMSLLSYRNLESIGFTAEQVKAIAAEYTVMDEPNDEGEILERPAKPSDRFKSPFANDKAAAAANNGAAPPDFSMIAKARAGGEDYIFALLTGYEDAPAGEEILEGQHWNRYFPGHKLSMAPPLSDGQVTYSDGTSATTEMAARDVSAFLAWASEPHMEARKSMGIKTLIYLFALTIVAYLVKRKVWSSLK